MCGCLNGVSRAGFEPALPKELELKSCALDHSAIETKGVVLLNACVHFLMKSQREL